MEIKKYYVTQKELGNALKDIVDEYLKDKLIEVELEKIILKIINLNKSTYYSKGKVVEKIKRLLGKRRLMIIERIIVNYKGGEMDGNN